MPHHSTAVIIALTKMSCAAHSSTQLYTQLPQIKVLFMFFVCYFSVHFSTPSRGGESIDLMREKMNNLTSVHIMCFSFVVFSSDKIFIKSVNSISQHRQYYAQRPSSSFSSNFRVKNTFLLSVEVFSIRPTMNSVVEGREKFILQSGRPRFVWYNIPRETWRMQNIHNSVSIVRTLGIAWLHECHSEPEFTNSPKLAFDNNLYYRIVKRKRWPTAHDRDNRLNTWN